MAYIGKQPVVGNFQVCDAITVVNGQAAYTMQVGSANVNPENANHMLVSLNGVLQKPGSSFTISGATITFASNLATGDVIDFIILLGDTLNVGTPSDDSVGAAQIKNDLISGTTALASTPDDTDEFLISDAGTLKRIDYSLIKSTPGLALISTTTVSSGVSEVDITSGIDSTYKNYKLIVNDLHPATDASTVRVLFFSSDGSPDTGSVYKYGVYGGQDNSDSVNLITETGSDFRILANEMGGGETYESASFILDIFNPSGTTFHKNIKSNFNANQQAGALSTYFGGCLYQRTSAITGIRVKMASGNIDSGTFKLYGIS